MSKKSVKQASSGGGTALRRYAAVGALVLALVLLGGAGVLLTGQGAATPVAPTKTPTKAAVAPTATRAGTPVPTVPPGARIEHVKGDANAKVTVIEYSDFQCPYCGLFAVQTFPQVDEKYIKTGKVKWIFRPVALSYHLQAPKATESAECAGDQGKYWEMHDMLFARQSQWSEKGGAVELFKGYAKSLSLNEATFAACLDGSKYASIAALNMADARKVGVSGTPTYFVNGTMVGSCPPVRGVRQDPRAGAGQVSKAAPGHRAAGLRRPRRLDLLDCPQVAADAAGPELRVRRLRFREREPVLDALRRAGRALGRRHLRGDPRTCPASCTMLRTGSPGGWPWPFSRSRPGALPSRPI